MIIIIIIIQRYVFFLTKFSIDEYQTLALTIFLSIYN